MNKILMSCLSFILLGTLGGWTATPKAVNMQVLDGESSVYVLYSDGYLQTSGYAVSYGYPSNIAAVDLTITADEQGYYILSSDGTIYSFGDAEVLAPQSSDDNIYVDMELSPGTNSPYFLHQDGSITASHSAVFYGDLVRSKKAVDLDLTSDGTGYYVLYEDGFLAFFGNAVNYGYTQNTLVKAVEFESTGNGYYVTLADGTIQSYGDATALPFDSLPDNTVVDMEITEEGYRILTNEGNVQSFIQVDAQGSAQWFQQVSARPQATATRTPTPTSTPTPTRTPSPTSSYFAFTLSGFQETIIGKIPDGSALPSSLDSGYVSLFTGGLFVVASDGEALPARKILFYSLEDSNDKTDTGTVFAQLESARGSAVIRGVAYSKAGLYVVVEDDPGTYIFLISGNFEDSAIQGFSLF